MMTAGAPHLRRIFTIGPTRPFLDVLARALIDGRLVPGFSAADPLALASATILVPTRRAARALQLALLDAMGARAILVPRIRPIGDIDEDLAELTRDVIAEDVLADRPDRAMPGFARHPRPDAAGHGVEDAAGGGAGASGFRQGGRSARHPAEAINLARALMKLMDQVATEGIGWDGLASLAPEEHARFWDLSLDFLKIVTDYWPAFLAGRGLEDPGTRRDRLIRREAARLATSPPPGPMIVAGSTGSVPATAALIRAVSRLEHGAVVLPGLDLGLDAAVWAAIGTRETEAAVSHPQYGLKLLLDRLDADREAVTDLDPETDPVLVARNRIIGEAMRPAAVTDGWAGLDLGPQAGAALAGLSLMEARNEIDEALGVAVALREAIHQGRSAALVTPNRDLARRVSAELQRFGLEVDDSAGQPLGGTAPATLARLIADIVLDGWNRSMSPRCCITPWPASAGQPILPPAPPASSNSWPCAARAPPRAPKGFSPPMIWRWPGGCSPRRIRIRPRPGSVTPIWRSGAICWRGWPRRWRRCSCSPGATTPPCATGSPPMVRCWRP